MDKQNMIDCIKNSIAQAMGQKQIIEDEWITFAPDWDINIWTVDGVTRAAAYETIDGETQTEKWVDLFEERLMWPSELGEDLWIKRDEKGDLRIFAKCEDLEGVLHVVDVTWLQLEMHEQLGEALP